MIDPRRKGHVHGKIKSGKMTFKWILQVCLWGCDPGAVAEFYGLGEEYLGPVTT